MLFNSLLYLDTKTVQIAFLVTKILIISNLHITGKIPPSTGGGGGQLRRVPEAAGSPPGRVSPGVGFCDAAGSA